MSPTSEFQPGRQPVLLLHLSGQPAELPEYRRALEDHGLRLIDCSQPDAAREHAQDGCKVGLLIITREAELAQLDRCEAAFASDRICWVALVERDLLHKPRMRDFIADHLFNFIALPAEPAHVVLTLRHAWGMAYMRETQADHAAVPADEGEFPLVGHSPQMQQLRTQLTKLARTEAPVLICGAAGSGKETASLAIHRQSARREARFVAYSCGAAPAGKVHAELFSPGGLAHSAAGGTLFLDGVDALGAESQAALLRLVSEPLNAETGAPLTRVVAASSNDLAAAVRAGRFRDDLYYRLNVMCLVIPPLAERGHDIEAIARHYFMRFARTHNRSLRGFSKAAMTAMLAHGWPGNVRELVNRVQRATVMAEGRFIQPEDLGLERPQGTTQLLSLEHARAAAERATIRRALAQSRNQISRAASLLGVSRVTLYRLIDKYNIRAEAPSVHGVSLLTGRAPENGARN